jgi:triphosphoribosyl-dephospho-CoA synthase
VCSRKVGNVHPRADFSDATLIDFALSAAAIGTAFPAASALPLGAAVCRLVRETRTVTRTNTNLGIVLLLVPLAQGYAASGGRTGVEAVLAATTLDDARSVYEAIRLAHPGGLGTAREQDVNAEPTVTLREAMALAADRDLIARQYANGFAEVLDFGVPTLLAAFERFGSVEAALIDAQLQWLARFPDSLIVRKKGPEVAAAVSRRAAGILGEGGIATPQGRHAAREFDHSLRGNGNGLNPGTTADLLTACLFVALREHKLAPSAPFRWQVPDWL